MKRVLALVLILHLFNTSNTTQKSELISELRKLNEELKQTKFTSAVHMPTKYMFKNAHICVSVFFTELRDVLRKLLVLTCCEDRIRTILETLPTPQSIPEDATKCRMKMLTGKTLPIQEYINFITRLSNHLSVVS